MNRLENTAQFYADGRRHALNAMIQYLREEQKKHRKGTSGHWYYELAIQKAEELMAE